MKHIFKQGEQGKPVFLLLHGTGGDERDLLPLAEMLDPSYNVLSVKGEISENGMARYFKRRAEGDDLEDYIEVKNYMTLLKNHRKEFNLEDVIPVGFQTVEYAINLILRESTPSKSIIIRTIIL